MQPVSGNQLPLNRVSGMNNYNLQSSLQYSLLSYIQTDDPILNTLVGFLIISLVTSLVPKLEKIPGLIMNMVKYIWNFGYNIARKFFWHRVAKKICKTVYIEKITDERQLNPLYTAVAWYLMNQVNLDEEEDIKFIIDDKISNTTNKLPSILKRVVQDLNRKLVFEGREVNYVLSASQISIDGEDNTRRNDKIKCWIETDKINDTFLEHFTNVCMDKYSTYVKNRANTKHIYQNMNGSWSTVCPQVENMADTIVLKGNDKDTLLTEVEHFTNNKSWYINHGFPYSLGILLHGPPGTGKTSLIRYISSTTGRNTHYLRLPQISSEEEFNNLLKGVDLANTVLVMEDIDCAGKIVHSRDKIDSDEKKNKDVEDDKEEKDDKRITIIMDKDNHSNKDKLEKQEKVTLDVLLNILDGILTTPGQIVIMTTNYKDVLDKALIRPGRIDINLELAECTRPMIKKLCMNFYGIDQDDEIPETVQKILDPLEEYKYTPAHVMNVFRKYKNNIELGVKNIKD